LIRNRPLTISEEELNANIEHLRERHAQGMIEVRTPDGRIIDLHSMEAGPGRVQSPDPNFPLDSVENDTNRGIDYPQFLGGAGHRDPAADRAAERIAEAKRVEEPAPADPAALPPADVEASITTSTDLEDPAAARAAEQGETHGSQDDQGQSEEASAAGVAGDEDSDWEEEQQPSEEVTKPAKPSAKKKHGHGHGHGGKK